MPNDRIIISFGDSAIASAGSYDIFGTNTGAETVTVFDNTLANFQGDFARGGDTIRLTGAASDFTIRISGSRVELISTTDGITAYIPIGITGATVQFEDSLGGFSDSRTLVYDGTNVVLDGQIVTSTATAVDPAPSPSAFMLDSPPDFAGAYADDAVDSAAFAQNAIDNAMLNQVVSFA